MRKASQANVEREKLVAEGEDQGVEGHDDGEDSVVREVGCHTSHRPQHICEPCRVPGTIPQALTKFTSLLQLPNEACQASKW